MAESFIRAEGDKISQYRQLILQIAALLEGERDAVANMANIAAVLKAQFSWLWVGFYVVKGEQLVLAPFQGPIACTRIAFGRGVCGAAWQQAATQIVPDVNRFAGHIACSSLSQSEIVVPVLHNGSVVAVLDIDSECLATFDEQDADGLQQIAALLAEGSDW